jgi:hypothetical protein
MCDVKLVDVNVQCNASDIRCARVPAICFRVLCWMLECVVGCLARPTYTYNVRGDLGFSPIQVSR